MYISIFRLTCIPLTSFSVIADNVPVLGIVLGPREEIFMQIEKSSKELSAPNREKVRFPKIAPASPPTFPPTHEVRRAEK